MMNYKKGFTALFLVLWTGSAIAQAPPVVPNPIDEQYAADEHYIDPADEQYLVENQALPTISEPVRSHIEVLAGVSYLYDSNTTQTADGKGGGVGVTDFGARYVFGDESARGASFGLAYLGQAFIYENSADRAGRDPLEHRLTGVIGLTGGKTSFRLDSDVYFSNGNSVEQVRSNRETRYASSNEYMIDAMVIRELPHGSLEFGVGMEIRDFDGGTNLNDGEGYYGDLAWFYQPGFAPKSAFGLGVRGGQDDFDANGVQDYVTPSFRWRYEMSTKTSLHTTTGYEFRSIDGGNDTGAFVYDAGATWAATEKTSLGISSYRDVQPSYVSSRQNFTANGVGVTLNHQLPADFSLISTAGYEVADYSSTHDGVYTDRKDDYFKAGVTLGRELSLWGDLDGSINLFYNFSQNNSTLDLVEFDRQIVGVRMGFKY